MSGLAGIRRTPDPRGSDGGAQWRCARPGKGRGNLRWFRVEAHGEPARQQDLAHEAALAEGDRARARKGGAQIENNGIVAILDVDSRLGRPDASM